MFMSNNMKICAVVPARGGSKGIPLKNIHKVCGIPLINYTLETLLKVDDIDIIIPKRAFLNLVEELELQVMKPLHDNPFEILNHHEYFEQYFRAKVNVSKSVEKMKEYFEENIADEIGGNGYNELVEMYMDRFLLYYVRVSMGDINRYHEKLIRSNFEPQPFVSFRASTFSSDKFAPNLNLTPNDHDSTEGEKGTEIIGSGRGNSSSSSSSSSNSSSYGTRSTTSSNVV